MAGEVNIGDLKLAGPGGGGDDDSGMDALLAEAKKRGIVDSSGKVAPGAGTGVGASEDVYAEARKRGLIPQDADEATPVDSFFQGFLDPVIGGAEMLSHVTPRPGIPPAVADPDKAAAAAISPPGKKKDPDDFDIPRTLGNMANPLNYVGPFAMSRLPASPMVRNVVSGATGAMLQPTEGEGSFAEQKAGQAGTGMAMGYGLSVAGKGIGKGLGAIGERLIKNNPEVLQNRAFNEIFSRFAADTKGSGMTATEAMELVEAAQQAGQPMSLVDIPQMSTLRSKAGSIMRRQNEGSSFIKNFLTERDNAAAQRLDAAINQHLHSGETAHATVKMLREARKAESRPLYEKTDQLQYIDSDRLQQFLANPDVKKGMARGYHLERLNSLADGRPFDPTMMGVSLNEAGDIMFTKTPNMRVLDMAKQGLDAMIADNRNELTGELNAMGRALYRVKKAYLEELDGLDKTGAYRQAREKWQGFSAMMDAVKLGTKIFNTHPEKAQEIVSELDPGLQEFYRLGVADVMRERIQKTGFGGDEAKALIKSPWMKKQLAPAFSSPKEFDAFVDAVTRERQMHTSMDQIMRQSPSAERIAEDVRSPESARWFAGATRAMSDFFHGRALRGTGHAYRLFKDVVGRPDPPLEEAMAKIMFSPITPDSPLARSLLSGQKPAPHGVTNPMAGAQRNLERAMPFVAGGTGEQTD